jgi:galactoside O-acetyltransferase
MKSSFYESEELVQFGFQNLGKNVLISRKASIYFPEKISIGDNVRIDDFCILSGKITIGINIHISAYVAIYGRFGVILEDYTGISPRTTIYSAMDDFSGNYLIGPIHDTKYTNVIGGEVRLCRYSQLGANVIVFPNIMIGEGVVVGAFSLIKSSLPDWGIYAGIPTKLIKKRNQNLLKLV